MTMAYLTLNVLEFLEGHINVRGDVCHLGTKKIEVSCGH